MANGAVPWTFGTRRPRPNVLADRSRRPLAPRFDAIDVAHWIQDQIKKPRVPAPMPQCIANPLTPPNAPRRTPETNIIAMANFRYLGFL